jgi:hypothetical protein
LACSGPRQHLSHLVRKAGLSWALALQATMVESGEKERKKQGWETMGQCSREVRGGVAFSVFTCDCACTQPWKAQILFGKCKFIVPVNLL